MGAKTKIAWTDATWNPWRGCLRVSKGCRFCYAEAQSKRVPDVLGHWGPAGPRVVAADSYWRLPHQWNREAEKAGVRRRVFLGSMLDFFEQYDGPITRGGRTIWMAPEEPYRYVPMPERGERDLVPIERQNIAEGRFRPLTLEDLRSRALTIIKKTPWLTWLILTKRPKSIPAAPGYWKSLPNVWIGTSVEDQETADYRVPLLVSVPAAMHFLSVEPIIAPVTLTRIRTDHGGHGRITVNALAGRWYANERYSGTFESKVKLVIVGGESGPHARPCNVDWIRSIRDECFAEEVFVFVKQLGSRPFSPHPGIEWEKYNPVYDDDLDLKDHKGGDPDEWPKDLRIRQFPNEKETT